MIKVSELTGAPLDYWTARAEGVPAEQLEIRQVQRSDKHHVVRRGRGALPISEALNYTSDPALWAPLTTKYNIGVHPAPIVGWQACVNSNPLELNWMTRGATPQEAICRAVVRAAFGDEVEDVPCV